MAPTKIKCDQITEGVCYSAPVFFDDGVNMFLAANHPAKKYHIIALTRWNVPFLVTAGKKLDGVNAAAVNSVQEIDASEFDTDIGELEAL
ncbi:MAG: phosphohydrolase [Treponema sp.]|nr:phosphohydrolase [Treponema sp.]MCR5317298.1 phosphohydrolase [Treponema sp.]